MQELTLLVKQHPEIAIGIIGTVIAILGISFIGRMIKRKVMYFIGAAVMTSGASLMPTITNAVGGIFK